MSLPVISIKPEIYRFLRPYKVSMDLGSSVLKAMIKVSVVLSSLQLQTVV